MVLIAWSIVAIFGGTAVWLLASFAGDLIHIRWLQWPLTAFYSLGIMVLTLAALGRGGRMVDKLLDPILTTYTVAMVTGRVIMTLVLAFLLTYGLLGVGSAIGWELTNDTRLALSVLGAGVVALTLMIPRLASRHRES